LDELDRKILGALRLNALTPFVAIARSLGIAEGTVRYRVKRLLREGVIQRFMVKVDPRKVGMGVLAFALINVIPGGIENAARQLATLDHVVEVHEVHTYGDLLLKLRAESLTHLADVISNHIKSVPGVVGSQVISVLNIWKEEA